MVKLTSYEDSLKILKATIKHWDRVEKVTLTNALDRHIAYDIIAKDNHPAKPTLAMDGYAFKWNENLNELKLLDILPAGSDKTISIKDNECVKTFTGSLMSDGADTLIPVENVEISNSIVKIIKPVAKNFAVRQVGESYKKGEILIKKGTKLNYAEIALLAELGIFHVSVFIKPKVAILATGSEIVDLGEPLQNDAQIRSSNHIALAMMMKKLGAQPIVCEIVKDDANTVKTAILNALKSADVLLTTGGVSMGDFDFVKVALKDDFEIVLNGADIKPGRHIKIARLGEKYIFALPGFPYSAMVMTTLYVRVLLNTWLHQDEPYIKAILDEKYEKRSPYLEFTAINLEYKDGKIYANLNGKKLGSSAIINNLTNNAALLVVPKHTKSIQKGEIVDILMMI
ncbi:molybdopterin molybdotransferase MoeA [Campylobacter majalis]|uniref:molybdopterin molybdotransferase MoeA n=1 Tax=Campylobacter majalis TaxID=2790656 RepID=UPI003D68487F